MMLDMTKKNTQKKHMVNKKDNNLDFIKIRNFCSTKKKALVSLCNDNLENVRYLQTPYGTNDYYLEYIMKSQNQQYKINNLSSSSSPAYKELIIHPFIMLP